MFKFKYFRKALSASKYSAVILAVLFGALVSSGLVAMDSLNSAGATLQRVTVEDTTGDAGDGSESTPQVAAVGGKLKCAGPTTATVNTQVTFTATGGTGAYSWFVNQANPENGNGASFKTTFSKTGWRTATVNSGDQVAICNLTIEDGTPPPGAGGNCTVRVNSNAFTNWIIGGPQVDGEFIHSPDYPQLKKSGTHTTDDSGNPLPRGQYTITLPQEVDGWKNPVVTPNKSQFCEPGASGQTITFNVNYTTAPAPGDCLELQASQITSSNSSRTAQVTITNPNPASSNCNEPAGFASYKTFVVWTGNNFEEFVGTQKLFDNTSATIAPGQSRTLTVQLPDCNWQVDAFKDTTTPKQPPFYGEELMRFDLEHGLGVCGDVQVPQLSCTANPTSGRPGDQISFTAVGGTGTFSWSAPEGNPDSGNGSVFRTSFNTVGTKTAAVTSGNQTATCPVTIFQNPQPQAPICSPVTQTVNVNQNASFTASGGNGSFSWSAPGGQPVSGAGSSFATRYSTPGTRNVTVTSNGRTDTCQVVVVSQPQPNLACSPLNQTVNVNQNAQFTATGGSGALTWTANGGNPNSGSGANFSTRYGTSGSKTVSVRDSGNRTATCNVQVNQVQQPQVSCSPSHQNADRNENVTFTASGGNGTFSWSAPGGSPSSGSGSSFVTDYDNDGTHTVVVTSGGQSDTCLVTIDEDEDDDLICTPSRQEVEIGERAHFEVTGGSGSYDWEADEGDADPDDGSGDDFSTRFFEEGTHDVRVRDSRGNTDTCRVEVEEEDDDEPRRPSCSPSSQTANLGEEVTFRASGGTGDFEWDADEGSPRFGRGSRFETRFFETGRHTVELESNGRTDTCDVIIEDEPVSGGPVCSPSTQTANVNDFVTFTASGGDGRFTWSTSFDGAPSTGSGSSFGTRFTTPGTKFVTVTSNGRTSQCVVTIGTVLGAASVVTGPGDVAAAAAGLGFLGAMGAYGAVFHKDRTKKLVSRLTKVSKLWKR